MTDIKRTIFAGFLIAGLTLFIPFYLQFIGVPINDGSSLDENIEAVDYEDNSSGWPEAVDGQGPSLELTNSDADNFSEKV